MSISISGSGAITGASTSYSFDQAVSIGGTVTYEDVSNVDSVGIITARQGVVIGTGASVGNPDNNVLGLYTDSSERLRIDSSGRLLVGATSAVDSGATSSLQLVNTSTAIIALGRNDSTISAGNDLGAIRFYGNAGGSYQQCAEVIAEADGTHANNDKPTRLVFSTTADDASSPTERLRITNEGHMGLGETSPDTRLHIKESTTGATGIFIQNSNGATNSSADLYFGNWNGSSTTTPQARIQAINKNVNTAATDLAFWTYSGSSTSERMRLDSDGRLLISLSSSLLSYAGLQIKGDGDTGGHICLAHKTTEPVGGNNIGSLRCTNSAGGIGAIIGVEADANWTAGSSFPSRIILATTASSANSPTERMRISSDGNFDHYTSNAFNIRPSSTSSSFVVFRITTGASSISTGTSKFVVRGDGDAENTNGTYTTISDSKFKENVVDAESQWEDLKAVRVRNFNFKEETNWSTHKQIGFVAQELETICPNLVKNVEHPDEDSTYKTVKTSVLYTKAIKALQEAMNRIETLETQNADLLARVTALEGN